MTLARTSAGVNRKRAPAQRTANQVHRCFPAGLADEAEQVLISRLDLLGDLVRPKFSNIFR